MDTLSDLFSGGLRGFSYESKKLAVWNKGHIIPLLGYDPSIWRKDDNGFFIKYSDHGDRYSAYGWEMDHFPTPKSLGGSDDISNLRPLHHSSNSMHGGLLGALLAK